MNNQFSPNPVAPTARPPQHPAAGKPKRGIADVIFYASAILVVLLLAAIAIPNFVRARTTASKSACPNNLRQIDSAKEQWALEHKKTQSDTPSWADLVGTDRYIKVQPWCPANGTYSIGNMVTKPICSIPDHTFP